MDLLKTVFMKKNFTLLCLTVLLMTLTQSKAQKMDFTPLGGEFVFNHDHAVCLTHTQRSEIKTMLQEHVAQLKMENKLLFSETFQRGGNHVLFDWPVRKAPGVIYNDVWGISGYVDHNVNYPNQLTDYNCGTRTYDTAAGYNHQGVDIYTWPFSWKQMDNNEAEIVAAAAGQIIAKGDGRFDRSCNFNNNTWNAVYIMHADGSIAWYGHMKNGSLTSKTVGDMVEQGEFLGIIGSSGNSTGPHLHFEVYKDNSYTELIDPYTGSCNSLNTTSWWQSQRPYKNTNINAALTHSAPPVFPTCPQTEITNESDQFNVNQRVYFAVYLRDQIAGSQLSLRIIRPDGSIFETWNSSLTQDYNSSYWYWTNNNFTIEGEWKWQVSYMGQTVTHPFQVGTLKVNIPVKNTIAVYPNPFTDQVQINSDIAIQKVTVYDLLGKLVKSVTDNEKGVTELQLDYVNQGVYFIRAEDINGMWYTLKIVK